MQVHLLSNKAKKLICWSPSVTVLIEAEDLNAETQSRRAGRGIKDEQLMKSQNQLRKNTRNKTEKQ